MKSLVAICFAVALALVSLSWVQASMGQSEVTDFSVPTVVAEDSSGNNHHGIISGMPRVGVPGRRGTAYAFDPSGSRAPWVQVPSSDSINPEGADFRLSAWVMLDEKVGLGETYDLVRKGHADTPTGEYKLEIVPPGHVRCIVKDRALRTARVTNRSVDVTDGAWHHVGCARTGDVWSAFVSGNIDSERVSLGSVGNTYPLSIGSKYGLEDAPLGRVDHVKLTIGRWSGRDDAIPADGVAGALRDLRSLPPTGLWRLNEQAQTTQVQE